MLSCDCKINVHAFRPQDTISSQLHVTHTTHTHTHTYTRTYTGTLCTHCIHQNIAGTFTYFVPINESYLCDLLHENYTNKKS